ncbi:MAG: hypothetical protein EXS31_07880 [Pedosphaera sp.]|nr:hypothetical protein [Pedosphaera sp.]
MAANRTGKFSGIGFVFAVDGNLTGIDFDHHIDPCTGKLDAFAQTWVDRFASYAELSQSGSGIHVIVLGRIPGERGRRNSTLGVEIYSEKRFFVMTGKHLPRTPATIEPRQEEIDALLAEVFPAKPTAKAEEKSATPSAQAHIPDDAELLKRARIAKNCEKFVLLYDKGNWRGAGFSSQSEADASLLAVLRFWTSGDKDRSFRLFEKSALYRPKWERDDYRNSTWATIDHGEFYSAGGTAGADSGSDADGSKERNSAAAKVVQLAGDFEFFHTPDGRAFAKIPFGGHIEIWPIDSRRFKSLLEHRYYQSTKKALNRNALTDAVGVLTAKGNFDGKEENVSMRVARLGDNILIDLCDPGWRVIEVSADGWRVREKSPVNFVRTRNMRALPSPAPSSEGSIEPLWEVLNVTPAQRALVVGALIVSYHPDGPFFILNIVGEQGTGKSGASKTIRNLIDPNEVPLVSPPRDERDLLVQATNNRCVAFDNLSHLPNWLSDALCRLSTGGGNSSRELFTNGEEFTFSVKRPVILNGIGDVASRPDLAERCLQIELELIPEDRRLTEEELSGKLELAAPVIFSAILNGLACALRRKSQVSRKSLPRMADAVVWAIASETAFGFSEGTFLAAYRSSINRGALSSVEGDVVGGAIVDFLKDKDAWAGQPKELWDELQQQAKEVLVRGKGWPKTPKALSEALKRLAPAFRRVGYEVEFGKSCNRWIRLGRVGNPAPAASTGGIPMPKR